MVLSWMARFSTSKFSCWSNFSDTTLNSWLRALCWNSGRRIFHSTQKSGIRQFERLARKPSTRSLPLIPRDMLIIICAKSGSTKGKPTISGLSSKNRAVAARIMKRMSTNSMPARSELLLVTSCVRVARHFSGPRKQEEDSP